MTQMKEKYPNQLFYLMLITAEEIMGKQGLNSILNYSKLTKFRDNFPPNNGDEEHPSEDFSALMRGFLDVLGVQGARPIMFRGGIKAFELIHEQFPTLFNINGISPEEMEIDAETAFQEFRKIYGIIVEASRTLQGDVFKFYDVDEGVVLEITPCHWCVGVKADKPICYPQLGIQYGIAKWVTGREIKVEETHCIAAGDEMCRFVMHRPEEE
jgi:predicted hydrocarbon binding protein